MTWLQKNPCVLPDMVKIFNQLRSLNNKVHTFSQTHRCARKIFSHLVFFLGHINIIRRLKKTSSNFLCPISNPYLGKTALGKAVNSKSKNDRRDLLPVLEVHCSSFLTVQVFHPLFFKMKLTVAWNNCLFSFILIFPFSFHNFCLP